MGAAMGALAGHFSDYGIDDNFIKSVQDQVTEGNPMGAILAIPLTMIVKEVFLAAYVDTRVLADLMSADSPREKSTRMFLQVSWLTLSRPLQNQYSFYTEVSHRS